MKTLCLTLACAFVMLVGLAVPVSAQQDQSIYELGNSNTLPASKTSNRPPRP